MGWRTKRYGSKCALWLTMTFLLSSCGTALVTSESYQVTMPLLQAQPLIEKCEVDVQNTWCATLLLEDYQAIVRELKAACLALGGDVETCQTDE